MLPPARPSVLPTGDPWRVLFPLGIAAGWAGVILWLLFGIGATDEYRPEVHAVAQIEGFMTSFALGFLLTFIPRRTVTAAPSRPLLAALTAAPAAVVFLALLGRTAASQVVFLALLAGLVAFAATRLRDRAARRRLPVTFPWVAVALAAAAAGSAGLLAADALGPRRMWIVLLGRGLLQQATFTALVIGVGSAIVPLVGRGEPPLTLGQRRPAAAALDGALAVAFLASFPIEWLASRQAGYALRAAAVAGVLVGPSRLWRRPTLPGLHRKLAWLSAWLAPAGYALVAVAPEYRTAGLHVVFIGCFALMALSVGLHVALSHGGHPERLDRNPRSVGAMAALLAAALAFRILANADDAHLRAWLGVAAACFLAATLCWGAAVLPVVVPGRRRPGGGGG